MFDQWDSESLFGKKDALTTEGLIRIDNQGTDDTTDELLFGDGVDATDIRFSSTGDDLMLDVMSANAQILLQDWYASPVDRIDEFRLSSGATLDQQRVDGLVDVWSQYEAGELDAVGLSGEVAIAWQSTSLTV